MNGCKNRTEKNLLNRLTLNAAVKWRRQIAGYKPSKEI